jgi:hypothetical protein
MTVVYTYPAPVADEELDECGCGGCCSQCHPQCFDFGDEVAEGVGFEPTRASDPARLAGESFQPLGHPSTPDVSGAA